MLRVGIIKIIMQSRRQFDSFFGDLQVFFSDFLISYTLRRFACCYSHLGYGILVKKRLPHLPHMLEVGLK